MSNKPYDMIREMFKQRSAREFVREVSSTMRARSPIAKMVTDYTQSIAPRSTACKTLKVGSTLSTSRGQMKVVGYYLHTEIRAVYENEQGSLYHSDAVFIPYTEQQRAEDNLDFQAVHVVED